MRVVLAIALLTYKEGVRSKALLGILILSLLLFGGSFLVSGMIMQEVGKVAVDSSLSVFSFSGLLLILFVGTNLLSKDLDKKTVYFFLSKPISRNQYILGKYIGLALLCIAASLVIGFLSFSNIYLTKVMYPNYFVRFSPWLILLSMLYGACSFLILAALVVLFSVLSSSSFISFILVVLSYLVGHSIDDFNALVEASASMGVKVAPLTQYFIKIVFFILPNLAIFDIKAAAAHVLSIRLVDTFWVMAYCVSYITLTLVAAMLIFRHREIT